MSYKPLYDGIFQVNNRRNKILHNLNTNLTENDIDDCWHKFRIDKFSKKGFLSGHIGGKDVNLGSYEKVLFLRYAISIIFELYMSLRSKWKNSVGLET